MDNYENNYIEVVLSVKEFFQASARYNEQDRRST
jgi:hypothetical protein